MTANVDLNRVLEYYRLAVTQIGIYTSIKIHRWTFKRAMRKAQKTRSAAISLDSPDRFQILQKYAPKHILRVREMEKHLEDELRGLKGRSAPDSAIAPALERMRTLGDELSSIIADIETENQ